MNHLFSTILGVSLATTCGAQLSNWIDIKPNSPPIARQNHPLVYDSARGVCVLFGGWTETPGGPFNAALNDTWEWDGATWTQITTPTSPPKWAAHAMAFDSKRNVTVVTGNGSGQTWEYDGTTWTQKFPVNHPVLGGHRPMTFDSARGVCVFFGNNAGVNETWEWDGTNWQLITTANQIATPCSHCSIAYDSLRQRTVMFDTNGQTWEYDGATWTLMSPPTTPPGRSCSFGMVYDDDRQVVVIFGGCGAAGSDFSTWDYDGVDWREHQTVNSPTIERRFFGMAYDSARKRTVLFGGRDFSTGASVVTDDTWEYDAGDCTLSTDVYSITLSAGGVFTFSLDGGPSNAGKPYFIFGSISGNAPGFSFAGVHIPLNPDIWTSIAAGAVGAGLFVNFNGVLDVSGKATAQFVVPPFSTSGFTIHQSYIVLGGVPLLACASNSVVTDLK